MKILGQYCGQTEILSQKWNFDQGSPMKLYLLFLILILISTLTKAHQIDPGLLKSQERCLKESEIIECEVAVSHFSGIEKYDLALEVSEKMCEMDAEKCSQSYFAATKISSKVANDILIKMQSRCSKNIDYCDTLSNIYEETKEFPQALEAAKKYYDKNHKGSYPWLSYQHGKDKTPAFESSLKECRADHSNCSFALRYMTDHPQYQELLGHAENYCKKEDTTSYGATTCSIVGTIYYKKMNFTKAFDFWSHDCKKNQITCMLLLGSEKVSSDLKLKAMTDFCNYSGSSREMTMANLEKKHCRKFKVSNKIPQEMIAAGEKSLKGFIAEQN